MSLAEQIDSAKRALRLRERAEAASGLVGEPALLAEIERLEGLLLAQTRLNTKMWLDGYDAARRARGESQPSAAHCTHWWTFAPDPADVECKVCGVKRIADNGTQPFHARGPSDATKDL